MKGYMLACCASTKVTRKNGPGAFRTGRDTGRSTPPSLADQRKARPHPWVLGTMFHQSCGMELQHVKWDTESSTLSGEVHRPRGETGRIVVSAGEMAVASQEVDGRPAHLRHGAGGSVVLCVTVNDEPASWPIRFADDQ